MLLYGPKWLNNHKEIKIFYNKTKERSGPTPCYIMKKKVEIKTCLTGSFYKMMKGLSL